MPGMGKRWEPWEDAAVLKAERTTASDTKIGREPRRTATAARSPAIDDCCFGASA